jgi:hypothetical protein
MNHEEVTIFLIPALKGLGKQVCVQEAEHLDSALGVAHYRNYYLNLNKEPAPEEYINLLRQLAGPHAHTILKAYRIKKGLEHDNSDGKRKKVRKQAP